MRRSRTWSGIAAVLLAGCALAAEPPVAAPPAASAADAPATVNALWVEREVRFAYMGLTTYYSCDGLRDKVRRVLRELGARPGFVVRVRGCVRTTGPEWAPSVEIRAALPAEATPELLAELARDASRRELVAKVSGKPADEATAQFPARARRVEFRSGPTGFIQDGDCELMEQMRNRAFPALGVRVVDSRITCPPRALALGAVSMTVEVLEPVPVP
jgi:hypothetical protein